MITIVSSADEAKNVTFGEIPAPVSLRAHPSLQPDPPAALESSTAAIPSMLLSAEHLNWPEEHGYRPDR
ncbi:MAG: hypothetical protein HC794_08940 [Nitrospiraceae bacterium]|nr:hypothetical protein [Nitrospiraceae bacterium]